MEMNVTLSILNKVSLPVQLWVEILSFPYRAILFIGSRLLINYS